MKKLENVELFELGSFKTSTAPTKQIIDHIETRNIWELLQQFTYFIPEYQRDYVWTSDLIIRFLKNSISLNGVKNHLGQIVLCKESEKTGCMDIVDGQQRVTTILLTLASIRDILSAFASITEDEKKKGEWTDFVNTIKSLLTTKSMDSKIIPRISSNQLNSEILCSILLDDKDELAKHRLLQKKNLLNNWDNALLVAYDTIKNFLLSEKIPVIDLYQQLIENTNITYSLYNYRSSAMDAYLSINASQKVLTPGGLIKVYINKHPEMSRLNERYNVIKNTLKSDVVLEDYVLHFVKYYSPDNDTPTKSGLFELLMEYARHDDLFIGDMVNEMYKKVNEYMLYKGERTTKNNFSLLVDSQIMNMLTYKAHLPLFLVIGDISCEKQQKTLFNKTVKFFLKQQTIMNEHGKKASYQADKILEELKSFKNKKAKENFVLSNKELHKIEGMLEVKGISNKLLSAKLKEIVSNTDYATETERKKAKALFLFMEKHHTTSEKITDLSKIHLDHVYPLNADSKEYLNFLGVSSKEFNKLVHKMGNFRLLTGSINSIAKDSPPSMKKPYYDSSELFTNRYLNPIPVADFESMKEFVSVSEKQIYELLYNLFKSQTNAPKRNSVTIDLNPKETAAF